MGYLYKTARDAADLCGVTEAQFLAAVDANEAPAPIARNVPEDRRLWNSRTLREWMARKAKLAVK